MAFIYYIKNIKNNKLYIGATKRKLSRRFREHKSLLNREKHNNRHLQYSWNKYGKKNFEFGFFEECDDNKINEKEKLYIEKYKSENDNFGYNLSSGGNINIKMSDETRKRMSQSKTGKKKPYVAKFTEKQKMEFSKKFTGEGNYMWGKKHKESTKILMGIKSKERIEKFGNPFEGKKHSEETIKNLSKKAFFRPKRKGSTSKYVGVSYTKKYYKWVATIKINKNTVFIGSYENEVEAATARDNFVIENKIDAFLNFSKSLKKAKYR